MNRSITQCAHRFTARMRDDQWGRARRGYQPFQIGDSSPGTPVSAIATAAGRRATQILRVRPPSTLIEQPLIRSAGFEARNTAVAAMSSGRITRPSGTSRRRCFSAAVREMPRSRAVIDTSSLQRRVAVDPGAIAFTVMPYRPNSFAITLVRLRVPKLIGPDIAECASGSRPRVPEILITRP